MAGLLSRNDRPKDRPIKGSDRRPIRPSHSDALMPEPSRRELFSEVVYGGI